MGQLRRHQRKEGKDGERLDLKGKGFTTFPTASFSQSITWLNASGNNLKDIAPLQQLPNLQVLNLGGNLLSGVLDVGNLVNLRALILNDNHITGLRGLDRLPHLNTLVVKGNKMLNFGTSLHGCTSLVKLSAAHNDIRELGNALESCTLLAELRLNSNALRRLPPELARNSALRILDLGKCAVAKLKDIKVLEQIPSLEQLNLSGCPLADRDDYRKRILRFLPNLALLDAHKVDLRGQEVPHGARAARDPTGTEAPFVARKREDGNKRQPISNLGEVTRKRGVEGGQLERGDLAALREKRSRVQPPEVEEERISDDKGEAASGKSRKRKGTEGRPTSAPDLATPTQRTGMGMKSDENETASARDLPREDVAAGVAKVNKKKKKMKNGVAEQPPLAPARAEPEDKDDTTGRKTKRNREGDGPLAAHPVSEPNRPTPRLDKTPTETAAGSERPEAGAGPRPAGDVSGDPEGHSSEGPKGSRRVPAGDVSGGPVGPAGDVSGGPEGRGGEDAEGPWPAYAVVLEVGEEKHRGKGNVVGARAAELLSAGWGSGCIQEVGLGGLEGGSAWDAPELNVAGTTALPPAAGRDKKPADAVRGLGVGPKSRELLPAGDTVGPKRSKQTTNGRKAKEKKMKK